MDVQKALVVGGAGFIGSNLVDRLVASGAEVTVVDNLLTGDDANVPQGVEFKRMSAAVPAFVREAKGDWDAVYHFGGASSAPLFDEAPGRLHEAVTCFQNVLEVARDAGAPVGFASTSSFYARCEKPYREDMAVSSHTLYEASKLSMENLATAYANNYGMDVTAFRFFSVYGPKEQGKGRFANIVSQFLWCMKAGIRPLVYGDGSQTRDFTHVDDLLDGLQLAMGKPGFEVYNIGTGVEHTFNQVLDKLADRLGMEHDAQYIANPIRNYVQETLANTDKLEALGWKARTTLDQGIERLVRESGDVSNDLAARMKQAHTPRKVSA